MLKANIIPLFVIIPLLSAFLISLLGKYLKRQFIYVFSNISCFLLLYFSFYGLNMLRSCGSNIFVYKIGGWAPPFGICLVFDGLAGFMLVIVNLIAFIVNIYSLNYIEKYTDKPKFFTLFFLMLTGMNGLIVTGDLFNLYIFLEVASLSSYALVAFGTDSEDLEASFKYAIMGSLASIFVFLGIAILYGFTSTLNMADMARIIAEKSGSRIIPFVSVLFIVGFGTKAALMPFHAWLPDAHPAAPASISAMLSGVLIKTLGIYALARILFNVIGISSAISSILVFLGALSLSVAVLLAFAQTDLKRLLAYSSISQVGYIILGIGLATPLGILGALFHLFNHSAIKSLLFLNAGAIDYAAGTRDLREMSGLKEKMPVTANTSLAASLSVAGIPPFAGFFSKLIIIFACIEKGYIGYAFIAVIGSILTLATFMKMQKLVFFGKLNEKYNNLKEVPLAMKLSMVVLAVICVCGGLLLLPRWNFFLSDAANVLLEGSHYAVKVFEAVK